MREKKALNVQIGSRVKAARETMGYTQENLAERVEVSVQYVSDLERGVVGASLSTIIKLCQILHVSSDFLLMGNERENTVDHVTEKFRYISPKQLELVERGICLLLEAFQSGDV